MAQLCAEHFYPHCPLSLSSYFATNSLLQALPPVASKIKQKDSKQIMRRKTKIGAKVRQAADFHLILAKKQIAQGTAAGAGLTAPW